MQRVHKGFFALAIVSIMFSGSVFAQSDQGVESSSFGLGQPTSIDDLPPGQFKRALVNLPPQAQGRALRWLQDFAFAEADLNSLDVDGEGGILYADSIVAEARQGASGAGDPAPQEAPQATLDNAFQLHSRPGAPNTVYLDFDGHVFSGTAWNSYGGVDTYYAKPYDLDGSPSTFNSTERERIAAIWHRVAEDLAPFDIDVTTEDPGTFDPYTGRVLITHTVDQNGNPMPANGGGGVAYVNVFGISNYHSYYSPALVYYDHLGNGGTTYVAEASSHEFGHNLGLSHDGTTTGTEYYQGHGSGLVSWAPIMGNSYYNNVTQWSIGEYGNANNTQDDIAIIDGKLGFIGDDHGDSLATATALQVDGGGNVVSSNPEFDPDNLLTENKGVIDYAGDVDVFSFVSGAGTVDLAVTPAWDAFYNGTARRGANLDVGIELRDAGNALVASNDPSSDTSAAINAAVGEGAYYLLVSGMDNPTVPYSNYNSMGQYFINGSVPVAVPDDQAPSPDPMQFQDLPVALSESEIGMTAVTATDNLGQVQYQFRCTAGGANCGASAWQASTAYTATGLDADTQYTFVVAARDPAGNETAPSAPASATTDAPPSFVDYLAQSDTAVSGSVSGTVASTHDDDGADQVITERESGGKPQNRHTYLEHRWNFTIGAGAAVTVFANAWRSGSNGDETFDLQYSTDGGNSFTTFLNVSSTSSANTQFATLDGAPSGSLVLRVVDTYRVSGNRDKSAFHVDQLFIRVDNGSGEPPPSDPPNGDPGGMTASPVSSSAIDLSWTDGSSNETGFLLERSIDQSSWETAADLPAGTESYSDTGLQQDTRYYYRVSAYNMDGASGYDYADAMTDKEDSQANISLSASGFKVKGAHHILLEWSGAETVDVYRDGSWVASATGGVYEDATGAKGGATYEHKVCASGGATDCSNVTTTQF